MLLMLGGGVPEEVGAVAGAKVGEVRGALVGLGVTVAAVGALVVEGVCVGEAAVGALVLLGYTHLTPSRV